MMDDVDLTLRRLLRSAAKGADDAGAEAPFGFDTRVVALWRAQGDDASLGIARFVRRIAVGAVAMIVLSAGATYREVNRTNENSELLANEFAIADSAIQDEFLP
jgi:hypothetical protein